MGLLRRERCGRSRLEGHQADARSVRRPRDASQIAFSQLRISLAGRHSRSWLRTSSASMRIAGLRAALGCPTKLGSEVRSGSCESIVYMLRCAFAHGSAPYRMTSNRQRVAPEGSAVETPNAV